MRDRPRNAFCKVIHEECDAREDKLTADLESVETRLAAVELANTTLIEGKKVQAERIRSQASKIHLLSENQIRVFDSSAWEPVKEYTANRIETTMAANFENWGREVSWLPKDSHYPLATKEQVIEYILWNNLNKWQYIKDKFDCDDFAWVFRAMFIMDTPARNCGNVWSFSGAHDYCFFVFADRTIWLYEPQNDVWWDSGTKKEGDMYQFLSGRVVV